MLCTVVPVAMSHTIILSVAMSLVLQSALCIINLSSLLGATQTYPQSYDTIQNLMAPGHRSPGNLRLVFPF